MMRWRLDIISIARIYLVFATGFIAYTWVLTILNRENFFKEGTFFTWISSLQIIALVFLSLLQTHFSRIGCFSNQKWGSAFLWAATALFLFYLGADEVFVLHEGGGWLKKALEKLLEIKPSPIHAELALLFIYAVIAGILGWRFFLIFRDKREILNHLGAGVILLILALFFDNFPFRSLRFPVVFEDGFKFLGFSGLLLGFLHAYLLRLRSLAAVYTTQEKVLWQILVNLPNGEGIKRLKSFQSVGED